MAKPWTVSVVIEKEAKEGEEKPKPFWMRVGSAFPHTNGSGFNIEIPEGVSVSGRLVLMPPREDEQK